MQAVRAIEFPSVPLLLDAFRHPDFTRVMDILFVATSDHAWVLGPRADLPPPPNVVYIDFALRGLDRGGGQCGSMALERALDTAGKEERAEEPEYGCP